MNSIVKKILMKHKIMTPEQSTTDLNMDGLMILARIVGRAYLADLQRDQTATKATKGGKKDESVSRKSRNRPHGKRRK